MRRILVLVSTLLTVALLSAGSAAADGPVEIKSRLGDACLDAPSDAWPTHVIVNPCSGASFQRWNINGGNRLESAAFPGKCLSFPRDIEAVHLVACWGGQYWNLQPDGHIAAPMGGCLTVLGGPDPGTGVGSRTCGGGPEQGWDIVP